jgi:hypothetical protein
MLKRVVVEWVLTNGKLPGFEERVKQSYPEWNIVEKSMIVYRAQGGDITYKPKGTAGPGYLVSGIRPVIATSKVAPSTLRYANERCCIFVIELLPGTRYVDVNAILRDGIDESLMNEIREICPVEGTWPTRDADTHKMIERVRQRCDGRTVYKGTDYEEYILPEHEIMVYGLEGGFSPSIPTGKKILGRALFKTSYGPSVQNARGRTFRRKALRRNKKDGHRLTRKSQNRRNR